MTATSLSFLEVFGLLTLFSLNYLANLYQESSQVQWRAFHAWLSLGTLSLCLLCLFISSLLFVAFSMRRTSSIPAPQGGFHCREACVTQLCSHTFSVGSILEPREGRIVTSTMLTPHQTNRPKRALTSMCMEVTYKCRLLGFSPSCFGRLCSHVAAALAWLLHLQQHKMRENHVSCLL